MSESTDLGTEFSLYQSAAARLCACIISFLNMQRLNEITQLITCYCLHISITFVSTVHLTHKIIEIACDL